MFRSFSGAKSQLANLTLLVVSEFDQWSVLVYGPGVTIHGNRQFAEIKAKEHALTLARQYLRERKHTEEEPPSTDWVPTSEEDWLAWRG